MAAKPVFQPPGQRSLLSVCDRFDTAHDLVLYLNRSGSVMSMRTSKVSVGLLGLVYNETTTKGVLTSATGDASTQEDKQRKALSLILSWT